MVAVVLAVPRGVLVVVVVTLGVLVAGVVVLMFSPCKENNTTSHRNICDKTNVEMHVDLF